nr:putative extracellular lipase [uncultured bacterium]
MFLLIQHRTPVIGASAALVPVLSPAPLRRRARDLCALLSLALLCLAGCKPAGSDDAAPAPSAAGPSPAAAPTASSAPGASDQAASPATPLETCLTQVSVDPTSAVTAFLELDLTSGQLFSPGTPLSYSEPGFVKLPRADREKVGEQAFADLQSLKKLVAEVKAYRKTARANGNTTLADRCTAQLIRLAQALESLTA